ncbi:Lrp/AsnC family transcriptional regulator [Dawidia soli]|uniref:Lrp/AsnC family transcriptional regulator n=1 Tax=Dawidia soli TaxID=2782352 RepID=A0AAP2GDX4_9BACT|nr:Lrp/AsnC family transcriptional regulator [Dawidia soli]MBT1687769.1 Lrp/AsnC family transcriptional regulator [Dawidia soli]
MRTFDELNWKILQELQKNARISNAEIGRRVGLSAPAVAERILRMEEDGVIQGYQPVIDYDKLNLTVKVFVHFKAGAMKHTEMVRKIDKIPQIVEWHAVTGENCMLLKVVVATTKELEALLIELGRVGDTTTSLILSGNTFPRTLQMP